MDRERAVPQGDGAWPRSNDLLCVSEVGYRSHQRPEASLRGAELQSEVLGDCRGMLDGVMPVRNRNTLLLDLDGTLVDPAAGIMASYRYAMERMGAPLGEEVDLRWVIGPPLRVTLARLLEGRGDIEAAVGHYRERYGAGGLFEARAYPDILAVLESKARDGARLILCTAKARVFAERVVEHFGFAPLLSGVYGPELDGRFDDKGDLIEHILATEALDPDQVWMVGDRANDVLAAARHAIPAVGVLWGYGSREELTQAGASVIISEPRELIGIDEAQINQASVQGRL